MENLVEAKHYKLTRSQRAGHSEKDLKPNATARNRLNEIISYPSTQTLTNEEKDQVNFFDYFSKTWWAIIMIIQF